MRSVNIYSTNLNTHSPVSQDSRNFFLSKEQVMPICSPLPASHSLRETNITNNEDSNKVAFSGRCCSRGITEMDHSCCWNCRLVLFFPPPQYVAIFPASFCVAWLSSCMDGGGKFGSLNKKPIIAITPQVGNKTKSYVFFPGDRVV